MPEAEKRYARTQQLSHEDVIRLVGDLDDATIAAILAIGATYQEIEQALKWAGAGPDESRLDAEGMTPTAEQVFDILLSDPTYAEEEQEGAR
ncbi:hypothetical protein [Dongia deserti]|uniref:hypothetical protein n=1 Tax=Dongia deserti TaxID=2268030 RepID=UPI000E654C99|nr:hypothetical protein [Dongia deserti]